MLERILEQTSQRDRRPAMINVILTVRELLDRFAGPIQAFETGTIRTYSEEHESTRHIGITSTLKAIDSGRMSVKGHRVWRLLKSCGARYEVLRTPRGHGTQLKTRLDSANPARIIPALP
jgi:hypothetical protein